MKKIAITAISKDSKDEESSFLDKSEYRCIDRKDTYNGDYEVMTIDEEEKSPDTPDSESEDDDDENEEEPDVQSDDD